MENYYDLLGVKPDCTEKQLKKAYKEKALKHHPDKTQSTSSDLFQAIQKAYEFLKNPENRNTYNAALIANEEREKRLSSASSRVKKFREELLKKEKEAKDSLLNKNYNIPAKRYANEEKPEEYPSSTDFLGSYIIKAKWDESRGYTESILRSIFEEYGPIAKIDMKKSKAIIHFCSEGSSQRAISTPPNEFQVSRLKQHKIWNLTKKQKIDEEIKVGFESKSDLVAKRMKILQEKLKSRH
ncbi:DNAJC17 [Blepharisma stoltei]|uniref:J domain-containing protein n=1 Tax=Blepharisma stoltei TaxID=1481888 RepID=A0AAU9JB71_9CILI|nr:unnamed protein product [Blepharisma stoltei]